MLIIAFLWVCLLSVAAAIAQSPMPLQLVQTIEIPNVSGRIEALAIDPKRKRLFAAARDNNSVEVIDLKTGKKVTSIQGFDEPQGLAFIADLDKLVVANARGGNCDFIAGESYEPLKSVKFTDNADVVKYDEVKQQVYVGHANGGLGVIDASNGKLVGNITLAGHPKSFELERYGTRIFANVPEAVAVAVIDREHRISTGAWTLKNVRANHALALDESGSRLFVATKRPARLLVFNTKTGRVVTELPCGNEASGVFFDQAYRRIYITCGDGFINVYKQKDADHYLPLANIATGAAGSCALYVPESGLLYVAIPRYGGDRVVVQAFVINP